MSTDSAIFLFFFLPLLLILEAIIRPVKAKNVFLCLAGLIFYAFGELWALALLIASALVNWALGLLAMRGRKYAVVLAAALNLALNLLGCYVHDLRLQCLEFFNRFYKEGGKPYKPLAIQTKYVDVIKEEQ